VRLNRIIDHYQDKPGLLAHPAEQKMMETCLLDDLAEMGFGRSQDRHPMVE
jgi:hypothetical protein